MSLLLFTISLILRVFLMPCKIGFQGQSTEIVLGTYMPIGERSSEIRIGKNFSGHAQKPRALCCSTKQELFWHKRRQMEQGKSWGKIPIIGAEHGSSWDLIVTL